ncbi:MAG: DUF6482 family protein [Kangiellaceae bacterium]|jgi:hypothetical protein|nr:DUF6482 family protein [Kangiellaceae bacterium]
MLHLAQLTHMQPIDKLIIHSIDISLYQALIEKDGVEFLIADNKGKPLRSFNIIELQKQFRGLRIKASVLRHESPYDEMIGHNFEPANNRLEVPLGDNELG